VNTSTFIMHFALTNTLVPLILEVMLGKHIKWGNTIIPQCQQQIKPHCSHVPQEVQHCLPTQFPRFKCLTWMSIHHNNNQIVLFINVTCETWSNINYIIYIFMLQPTKGIRFFLPRYPVSHICSWWNLREMLYFLDL